MLKQTLKSYATFILSVYALLCIFRFFETSLLFYNFGFSASILKLEIYGCIRDLMASNLILICYFPIYYLFYKSNRKFSKAFSFGLLFVFAIYNFLILKYFSYQQLPLDVFLFQYSPKEVFFTINTSNISLWLNIILLMAVLLLLSFTFWKIHHYSLSAAQSKFLFFLMLLSIPLWFFINSAFPEKVNKYSNSKAAYFSLKSFNYFFEAQKHAENNYTVNDFQALYPKKSFINKHYPLLHKANRKDSLGSYFKKFKQKPNIVILIVEGLNDDYLHHYKGLDLMPFLQSLKDKSLYWKNCFTLGERSFAVVPSLLGGLPYGKIGFTLLDNLPRHLSLVSILKSKQYYTSYFDGQGAWFHKKDQFFKYNMADLIFDKDLFYNEYHKIIVGDDNFFWGYNDKDLFNQSLRVIDSLNPEPRLDIYFTGTTHAPFLINDEAKHYAEKLEALKTPTNASFVENYSKYLKSVIFADDALKGFFKKYRAREDFENTIFVITGDHPITELPIANSLKRYHVPLIIYSPKLKKPKTFRNVVSHLDFSESFLSFLQNYTSPAPALSTSLGQGLLAEKETKKIIPFMNDNREIIDLYSDGFYLSGDQLFKVDSHLTIKEIQNPELKKQFEEQLNSFKQFSYSSSLKDQIISDSLYCRALNQQIQYAAQSTKKDTIHGEYYELIKDLKFPNKTSFFDFKLRLESKADSSMSLVYQIKNKNDSSLLWQNRGFQLDKKQSSYQLKIPQFPIEDSILYFNAFIWSQNKRPIVHSKLKVLLRSSNSHPEENGI